MGIRPEQLNIEWLLKFFIGRNEFKRENIVNMLRNLSNIETNTLGIIGFDDLYRFKQNLYLTLKNEIIDGYINNLFNNVDKYYYKSDSYYYESFLRTWPFKYILKIRNINYREYETQDQLWEKVLDSNPKQYDTVVGSVTVDDFNSVKDFKPEYFYADKDSVLKISLKQLLRDRSTKFDNDANVETLIETAMGTNPVVTEFSHTNDSYLEPDAIYTYEYLSKYGAWVLLNLRNYDYYDQEPKEDLFTYTDNTNPVREYVANENELPLKYNGYYDSEFLEKYGYVMLLRNRGVTCSFDMTLEELKNLVKNGNPEFNDAYSNSILANDRDIQILWSYVNNYIRNKTIEVDNQLYFKQGYSKFIGRDLSVEIEHNAGLAPIAALIQPSDMPSCNIDDIWVNMDVNKLSVYSSNKNISSFNWTLFFDNKNYIQFIKNSDYNINYFKETFGSIYLKRIRNDSVSYNNDDPDYPYYLIDLSGYIESVSLNEVLFINGVSYPLVSEDSIQFDPIEKTVKFFDLKINPDDEIVLTCIAKDYYENKDFEDSVYVNDYSSFGEENFAGNYNYVEIKHYLKDKPKMVIITPIENDLVNDDHVGTVSYEVTDTHIRIFNTGAAQSKFRWFAINCETVNDIEYNFENNKPIKLQDNALFYTITLDCADNELPDIGTVVYERNELTNELTISELNNTKRDYVLHIFSPKIPEHLATKTKFLEYTNAFENNENGKFDNSPFTKPNGTAYLNYSGRLTATTLQAYKGKGLSAWVPVFKPEEFEDGDVIAYDQVNKCYVKANGLNVNSVAGVVCNDSSISMNCYLTKTIPIALLGIVDVKVKGAVKAGDFLTVSAVEGVACSTELITFGTIIGKALENYSSDEYNSIAKIKMIVSIM